MIFTENWNKDKMEKASEDFTLESYECELQSMFKLDAAAIIWGLDEERFDENRNQEDDLIELFNKLNIN